MLRYAILMRTCGLSFSRFWPSERARVSRYFQASGRRVASGGGGAGARAQGERLTARRGLRQIPRTENLDFRGSDSSRF